MQPTPGTDFCGNYCQTLFLGGELREQLWKARGTKAEEMRWGACDGIVSNI